MRSNSFALLGIFLVVSAVGFTTQASSNARSCGLASAPASAVSPMWSDLMKAPLASTRNGDPLSDLPSQPKFQKLEGVKIDSSLSDAQRVSLVKSIAISDVVAAPGHRLLRNPKQVNGLAEYITTSKGGDFSHDPLLINIVVRDGNVVSVDLWNAHHRLVAYLKAGYKSLGEIPSQNFKVLINGAPAGGHMWGHYLPMAGLDPKMMNDYSIVPVGGDIRIGTISKNGALSNIELGSRNSIGRLYKNTFELNQPRIGVMTGTLDPIHEGHIQTALQAMRELQLDEVIFVPNYNAVHKPNASSAHQRIQIARTRLSLEPRLNLYTGDSSLIVDQFGRTPLFERLSQIYGTKTIFQIVGGDSYQSHLDKGEIAADANREFIVMPRKKHEVIQVNDALKSKVHVLSFNPADNGVSSTLVRKMLSQGQIPSETLLHPSQYEFIRANGFYR